MRSECAPHQKFCFIRPTRCGPHALEVCQHHFPQRPVHQCARSIEVMVRDLVNQRREVPEVDGAAFLVGGTFPLRLEDFREVSEDVSPNAKKSITNPTIAPRMAFFSAASVIAAKRAAFASASVRFQTLPSSVTQPARMR